MKAQLPLVAVPCDVKTIDSHPFHSVGEKYVEAVAHGAGCMPVLLPAMGEGRDLRSMVDEVDMDALLSSFDGVFLTGSTANVEPGIYGQTLEFSAEQLDLQRDDTTLRLIERAIALGLPLLAVCRGLQELNVAYGGTLHQLVHQVPGCMDHREDRSDPREVQYGPAHEVRVSVGGVLNDITGLEKFDVNSLHGQGIDRLGEGLDIEAVAPDGLVEAVSVRGARAFALGVQWHPEWRHWEDDVSSALFKAFGDAVREHARQPQAAVVSV